MMAAKSPLLGTASSHSSKIKIYAALTLGVALIAGIVACATQSIFTVTVTRNGAEASVGFGIWSSSVTGGGKTVTTDNPQCTVEEDQVVNDCVNALAAKCKANKAFIILGIVSNAVAIAPLFLTPVPTIVGGLGAGFASFSYMIVMSISASEYNGERTVDSDCGLGLSENDNAAYGFTFISLVAAFVLSLAGGGLAFMASMK